MRVTDPLVLVTRWAQMSTAELDVVIAELARPELRPTPAHELARASALGARFERDHAPETLAEALQAYTNSVYRGPTRGHVGRGLVMSQLLAAMLGQPFDPARVSALIDEAGDDPAMPGAQAMLHTLTDLAAALEDDPRYSRADALRRLEALEEQIPPEHPLAAVTAMMRTALGVKRGGDGGVYGDALAAADQARALLARHDLDPRQRALAETMLAAADGMAAAQHGEPGRAASAALAMTELVDRLPPDDPAAGAMRGLLAGATGTGRPEAAGQPGLSDAQRAWRLLLAATSAAEPALQRQDVGGLDRATRMLREAAGVAPPGYPHLPMIGTMLGRFLCARYQLGGGRPALDEALRRLTDAQRAEGHPGHPVWSSTTMGLALAYRLDGRLVRSRETGHLALRGHAWSVLLQAGTAEAAAAARHAADEAKEVARWCVTDADAAGAAVALDAGRCLLLYAATATMDIPARLRGLGRDDLVSRWREDEADADVRAEVLTALTGAPLSEAAVPDLLDPPALDEVSRALAEVRADALVYLVPRDDQGAGYAVLVPAEGRGPGRPTVLPLPGLTATGRVARHLETLNTRDAGAADAGEGTAGDEWRAELDRLCSWAWTAAVGPLLDTLERWRIGRAPRVVLIPMGDLAVVPWHAARDRDGTRAVQVATFSYAASARLLCRNVERPPVAAAGPVLMVGDPTGDLPDALAEANAVRDVFYPYADSMAGSAATPEAVLGWLLAGGGAVLHLACHGAVRAGVDGSCLRLAGGRLTAREILETRQATEVGLVALAACTTTVPSGSYDEAFSLATAFQAAGARTVFGSLWPVPSDATSLLMFMAHHYLCAEGKRPVDALNHAQRWMLDPDRVPPADLPAGLAALLPLLTTDVAGWAGFTHQGR